jgi:hypothetical protein
VELSRIGSLGFGRVTFDYRSHEVSRAKGLCEQRGTSVRWGLTGIDRWHEKQTPKERHKHRQVVYTRSASKSQPSLTIASQGFIEEEHESLAFQLARLRVTRSAKRNSTIASQSFAKGECQG